MNLLQSNSPQEWLDTVVSRITELLHQALQSKDKAVMIAAGGTTPVAVYGELGKQEIDWERVVIIPSDERWVPENTPRSNLTMIKDAFISNGTTNAVFQSLYMPTISPSDASPLVSKAVAQYLPADVCILGMGEDMHTASLFPKTTEVKAAISADAPIVLPASMPESGEIRMTLSYGALKQSENILILIKGIQKKASLYSAFELKDPFESPIYPFLTDACIYYVD